MELWAVFAILAALFWSFVSIIDKHVINQELKDPIIATFVASVSFITVFSIIALIKKTTLLPVDIMAYSLLAGIFTTFAIWFYYYALREEEVSRFISVLLSVTSIPSSHTRPLSGGLN